MERFTEVVNPYFKSLEGGRVCPRCGKLTFFEPSANSPDVVMERCRDCGAIGALVAPEWAQMGGEKLECGLTPAKRPQGKPKKPAEILTFRPRA